MRQGMSKGDWPRPANKKKFDEEFDRIFKKEKKKEKESQGGERI